MRISYFSLTQHTHMSGGERENGGGGWLVWGRRPGSVDFLARARTSSPARSLFFFPLTRFVIFYFFFFFFSLVLIFRSFPARFSRLPGGIGLKRRRDDDGRTERDSSCHGEKEILWFPSVARTDEKASSRAPGFFFLLF